MQIILAGIGAILTPALAWSVVAAGLGAVGLARSKQQNRPSVVAVLLGIAGFALLASAQSLSELRVPMELRSLLSALCLVPVAIISVRRSGPIGQAVAWTALLAACAFLRADAHGAELTVLLGEWGGAASRFGVVLYHAATACGLFAAILCIHWIAGRIESPLLQAAATFLTIVFGGLAATGFLTRWMGILLARWPANGFG